MNKIILLVLFLWNTLCVFSQTPQLPDRINACNNEAVMLDAGEDFASYLWNTGDTTQTITVKEQGKYTVTVTDTLGIVSKDSCIVHYLIFEIIPKNPVIYCPGNITLRVIPDTLDCIWMPLGITNDTVNVSPNRTTQYRVTVSDGNNFTCTDTVTVKVIPPFSVILEQISKGCFTPPDSTCDGGFKAVIKGGMPPYTILWDGAEVAWDTIAVNLCAGNHNFSVTDASLCGFDTTFYVDSYKALNATIKADPEKVYLQNPTIQFSFEIEENASELYDWEWYFGDGSPVSKESSPIHVYSGIKKYYDPNNQSYTDTLHLVRQIEGCQCDTNIIYTIPIEEIKFELPNVMTPNSDGANDVFRIDSMIYYYKQVELVIFNRWGKKVYESSKYNNDFNGGGLDNGVYFLILRCHGYFRDDVFKGSLTIIRN
ncbi:MAG: gliding motility-associated C-terminal domain-containing protein [Lentimicrobiaceae bacterium]|nr:gliding motility-associated C-terminal domain-containing protein [Lentimicrobiaceae bacterium]